MMDNAHDEVAEPLRKKLRIVSHNHNDIQLSDINCTKTTIATVNSTKKNDNPYSTETATFTSQNSTLTISSNRDAACTPLLPNDYDAAKDLNSSVSLDAWDTTSAVALKLSGKVRRRLTIHDNSVDATTLPPGRSLLEEDPVPSIECLPDKILAKIFHNVDTSTLVVAVPMVCIRWRRICRYSVSVELSSITSLENYAPLMSKAGFSLTAVQLKALASVRFETFQSTDDNEDFDNNDVDFGRIRIRKPSEQSIDSTLLTTSICSPPPTKNISNVTDKDEIQDREIPIMKCKGKSPIKESASWSGQSEKSIRNECITKMHESKKNLNDGHAAIDCTQHLREMEMMCMPRSDYMTKQRHINFAMRFILVDWLVEVQDVYRLNIQTLFIAVNYIDRFLSTMFVQTSKLQLVGVAALMLAAKYEEIWPPSICMFSYITANSYTQEQILQMEHLILKALKFDMGSVTACSYHNIITADYDHRIKMLCMYISELSLLDGARFLRYRPSTIAVAALVTALDIVKQPCDEHFLSDKFPWVVVSSVQACYLDLKRLLKEAKEIPQLVVLEKYSHDRYESVSTIPV